MHPDVNAQTQAVIIVKCKHKPLICVPRSSWMNLTDSEAKEQVILFHLVFYVATCIKQALLLCIAIIFTGQSINCSTISAFK